VRLGGRYNDYVPEATQRGAELARYHRAVLGHVHRDAKLLRVQSRASRKDDDRCAE